MVVLFDIDGVIWCGYMICTMDIFIDSIGIIDGIYGYVIGATICLMFGIGIIRIMGLKWIRDCLALDLIYNGKRPTGHIQW